MEGKPVLTLLQANSHPSAGGWPFYPSMNSDPSGVRWPSICGQMAIHPRSDGHRTLKAAFPLVFLLAEFFISGHYSRVEFTAFHNSIFCIFQYINNIRHSKGTRIAYFHPRSFLDRNTRFSQCKYTVWQNVKIVILKVSFLTRKELRIYNPMM